jgi:hypothetical protein
MLEQKALRKELFEANPAPTVPLEVCFGVE